LTSLSIIFAVWIETAFVKLTLVGCSDSHIMLLILTLFAEVLIALASSMVFFSAARVLKFISRRSGTLL